MAKVILKSNYIKGGGGAHGKNLVNYIGTRDGVEKNVQKYVDYISNRNGVEKVSNHGLFTSGNSKIILSNVMDEVADHKGNIWLPIISLTREDAIKTGFDNGAAWKNMLSKIAPKIAEYYKIKIDNLCWYASFHDEGHHPHVHMIVYSKNPNEGYLTKKGIEKFKSMIMKEVFSLEMEQVYAIQTVQRNELKQLCKDIFSDIKYATVDIQPELSNQIFELKMILNTIKGKKTYGYLKKSEKEMVDKIVNILAEHPSVKKAYDLWYESKFEIYKGYADKLPEKMLLSQQQEFKSIKNMIISEVNNMEIDMTESMDISELSKGVLGMFKAIENLFTNEIIKDSTTQNHRIDKKAMARLIEKKAAKGQKHTGEDLKMSMY